MPNVGDIIMGCREQMTDLPKALGAPVVTTIQETAAGPGPIIFVQTQIVTMQITQLNPWGESNPVSATHTITNATAYLTVGVVCSYSATAIRVYFTTTAAAGGVPEQYFELPVSAQGVAVVTLGGDISGISLAPLRSSAWLPDTDGQSASAASMFRWLNDGLDAVALKTNGIRDITGIPVPTVGQAQFPLINRWKKIDNVFFWGYPVIQGTKQQVFRHSNVTGLTGTITFNVSADKQMIEAWPQPNVASGGGTLSSAISATDTTLTYTPGSNGNFILGFGAAIIGTYPPTARIGPNSCEVVYYSMTGSGSQATQLQRGLGGTVAQAWPIGTPIAEGLIFCTGLRFPHHYSVGDASMHLSLPPAWVDAMRIYLLYRFRDAEQNRQEAMTLRREFEAAGTDIAMLNQPGGPRRIQVGANGGVEVAGNAGSFFGGVILP